MPIGFDLNSCVRLCEKWIDSPSYNSNHSLIDSLCNLSISGVLPLKECIALFCMVLNSNDRVGGIKLAYYVCFLLLLPETAKEVDTVLTAQNINIEELLRDQPLFLDLAKILSTIVLYF